MSDSPLLKNQQLIILYQFLISMHILCMVEYLEYGLHALVPDGWASHRVEDLIERTKQSLNKHIPQCRVFPHCYKPGILLR